MGGGRADLHRRAETADDPRDSWGDLQGNFTAARFRQYAAIAGHREILPGDFPHNNGLRVQGPRPETSLIGEEKRGLKGFYFSGKPGNFAGNCIAGHDAFGAATHEFRLGGFESGAGGSTVAGTDSFFHLFYKAANAADTTTVDRGLARRFADSFLR